MVKYPNSLLAKGDTNAKLSKSNPQDYVMYLSPHKLSGAANLCAFASLGCLTSCLNTSGRGMYSYVQLARKKKTLFFVNHKQDFLSQLYEELVRVNNLAIKKGRKLGVRLNGTSDLDFIMMLSVLFYGSKDPKPLFEDLSEIIFYDYTKDYKRLARYEAFRSNYVLTFSLSEDNAADAIRVLRDNKFNVSAVFDHLKPLPKYHLGFPVIDGDHSDARYDDEQGGLIIGLKAKGRAKQDVTGFVIREDDLI